jgi:hypothetical protein
METITIKCIKSYNCQLCEMTVCKKSLIEYEEWVIRYFRSNLSFCKFQNVSR